MIYLSQTSRRIIVNKIREILDSDKKKLSELLSVAASKPIQNINEYIENFMFMLNLDELAYKHYTLMFAFGILMIVDYDEYGDDIRVRYGVSPTLADIRIKITRRK